MADGMIDVASRLTEVRSRIERACAASGRSTRTVQLVAVSKFFSSEAIAAAASAGQRDFGENYVQEALAKMGRADQTAGRRLRWHFIGPVQSNKTSAIAACFDWVHGVERLKIAQRLSAQRPDELPPLNVCVQVNVSGEASKSGCQPDQAQALCAAVARLPRLRLRGLMCIPEADTASVRPAFAGLRALLEDIRARALASTYRDDFDTLSMGMSADFELAIAEGATLVRVGSAIFGPRPTSQLLHTANPNQR